MIKPSSGQNGDSFKETILNCFSGIRQGFWAAKLEELVVKLKKNPKTSV